MLQCFVLFSVLSLVSYHRRSQDFLCWVHFFSPKIWWPFLSRHRLLHSHMRYPLPPTTFLSHVHACISPHSAPFLSHFNKNAYKFFSSLLGVHLHPLATPMFRIVGLLLLLPPLLSVDCRTCDQEVVGSTLGRARGVKLWASFSHLCASVHQAV